MHTTNDVALGRRLQRALDDDRLRRRQHRAGTRAYTKPDGILSWRLNQLADHVRNRRLSAARADALAVQFVAGASPDYDLDDTAATAEFARRLQKQKRDIHDDARLCRLRPDKFRPGDPAMRRLVGRTRTRLDEPEVRFELVGDHDIQT